MLSLVIVLLIGYLSYRAIRGGFARPQSEKLNGYGIFALILLLIWAVTWVDNWLWR